MTEFNCNQLKNVPVPESWIENALNAPDKKRKYAIPHRFYYAAASTAACLVIALGVTFSLMFGFNKNVDLTDPNRDDPYKTERTTDESYYDSITGGTSPNGDSPFLFGGDNENSTIVTEPAETDAEGNTLPSGSKQKTTSPTSGRRSKKNTPTGSNSASSDTEYIEPGEDETPGENIIESPEEPTTVILSVEEPNTEEPTTEEPVLYTNMEEEYSHTEATKDPNAERYYKYSALVFNGRAKGDVYFKLTDQNGTVLANGLVTDKTPENGKTRISYSVYMRLKAGDTYTAVFYSSDGKVIYQQSYYIWS